MPFFTSSSRHAHAAPHRLGSASRSAPYTHVSVASHAMSDTSTQPTSSARQRRQRSLRSALASRTAEADRHRNSTSSCAMLLPLPLPPVAASSVAPAPGPGPGRRTTSLMSVLCAISSLVRPSAKVTTSTSRSARMRTARSRPAVVLPPTASTSWKADGQRSGKSRLISSVSTVTTLFRMKVGMAAFCATCAVVHAHSASRTLASGKGMGWDGAGRG